MTAETFEPVGACIYCGATNCRLSDEHIVPFSLNGTLVLPSASCETCADVTKRFEQTVARSMYGTLRIKHGFRTRRKKDRPSSFAVIEIDETGIETEKHIPVSLLPTTYWALELPLPGILTGAPKSAMNPEMKVQLKADLKELEAAQQTLGAGSFEISVVMKWGPFCRLLAKIGHCYAMAVLRGKGYQPLLPDIILGRSEFLSHYVGGASSEVPDSDLWLELVSFGESIYVTVGIVLLGRERLPPYQVVVGLVTNPEVVVSAAQQRAGTST